MGRGGGERELRVASPHSHLTLCRLEAEFDEHPARLCYGVSFYFVVVCAGLGIGLAESQGTSKCGSHRHGCVSSSRSRERRERGRRERGLRAGPEGQRCYEVVRVHRLQQCRVCCWVPLRAVF